MFNWWFSLAPGIQWCCFTTSGSPGVTIRCSCRVLISDSSQALFLVCLFPMLFIDGLENFRVDQMFRTAAEAIGEGADLVKHV